MGNYESLRIGIDLSVPCNPDIKSIESAFQAAAKYTEVKLDKLVQYHKGDDEQEDMDEFDL